MSEISDRFQRISDQFGARLRAVPDDAWDNPAPCEGWVARDVVRHMVEWMPSLLLQRFDLPVPEMPSVDEDPVGAWDKLTSAVHAALENEETAARQAEVGAGMFQSVRLDVAVDTFGTPDVLIHTWDLARATGLDEQLDPETVGRTLAGLSSIDDEMLRGSGQFGPRVEVPDTADDQTKLLALSGRHP